MGASLFSVLESGDLLSLRRQFRQLAPAGTEFAVAFSATAMSLRTPQSVGRYDYSAFRSLDLSKDYVFLRSALGGTYFVLPRELFTDEDIARFRAGVGSRALHASTRPRRWFSPSGLNHRWSGAPSGLLPQEQRRLPRTVGARV